MTKQEAHDILVLMDEVEGEFGEVWPERWDDLKAMIERVLGEGVKMTAQDVLTLMGEIEKEHPLRPGQYNTIADCLAWQGRWAELRMAMEAEGK